ncbi:ubiquinone biosynthesis protein UbiJ [Rheinheimera pacifica]|uniref:ubiquinone biosynthesis accessory factor UbiJ n=1 Tax=Rheinheimera pacifica TaxID=173990 RepID=UPI00285D49F5|nr:SCP2 sterol-binding domain-containing protein [Rheinheimera pacifica]MDR6984843.1 ubiquinone biosynthesis protein UbiJ [Rheinheimera pacifica]
MLPLLPQLLCAVAEKTMARLIAMDPLAAGRLSRLYGKQLSFRLREWPVTLVLSASAQGILFNQHDEAVDCAIETDLASLRLLRDPSQLTRLIKADTLQIDGDIQVAQQYSHFFQQLDPDWQQTLSAYVGDASAHKIALSLRHIHQYLSDKTTALHQLSTELAQDELQLTPTAIEMTRFSSAVSELAAKVDVMQQQLQAFQEL